MAFASHASLATPRLTGRVEDLERKYAQRVREAKSSIEELKEGSLLFQSAGKPWMERLNSLITRFNQVSCGIRYLMSGEPKEVWAPFHVLWCFELTFWWRSIPKPMELGKLSFRGASQRYRVTSCHMLSCYEYALYLLGPLNLAPLCKPGHATEEAEGSTFFFWLIYVLEKTWKYIHPRNLT